MRTIIIAILVSFGFAASVSAQCDSIASICSKNITAKYISDGQSYRALLSGEEVAEFKATFYGGSIYRISACSGFTAGNLIFSIYDEDRNLLYSSSDYKNAPYWDFKFASTVDCTIEAKLNSNNLKSGCAAMVIGFK